ncbi:hypothetical protein Pmani_025100 [Petrolisthes manimaculis]|uniref:Uncharacterized protein n=1 Tax=Petrolisthes manimaculis TaxID=1843537 RepID=A0AAE1P8P2_9EUCA|nr:hypothetical protein Pmani_025100 [Petrolisthes manimaculis]
MNSRQLSKVANFTLPEDGGWTSVGMEDGGVLGWRMDECRDGGWRSIGMEDGGVLGWRMEEYWDGGWRSIGMEDGGV